MFNCCEDKSNGGCPQLDGTSYSGRVQQTSRKGVYISTCECDYDPVCPEETPPPPMDQIAPLIEEPPHSNNDIHIGLVVGVSCAAAVLLLALFLIYICYVRGQRRKEEMFSDVQSREVPNSMNFPPCAAEEDVDSNYAYSTAQVQQTFQLAKTNTMERKGESGVVISNPVFGNCTLEQ